MNAIAAPTADPGSGHTDVERRAWQVLGEVCDPEIPALSLIDLGVVRYVHAGSGGLRVGLTPTWSGCPATEVIRHSARAALEQAGLAPVTLEEVLTPPWTSDWITERGRERLAAFGIAPPPRTVGSVRELRGYPPVRCPRCQSTRSERVSEFGSTPCKAHHRCLDCREPFDAFKCL